MARYLSCRDHHSNAGDHRKATLTKADTNITLLRMTNVHRWILFSSDKSPPFYFFLFHYLIDLHCKKKEQRSIFVIWNCFNYFYRHIINQSKASTQNIIQHSKGLKIENAYRFCNSAFDSKNCWFTNWFSFVAIPNSMISIKKLHSHGAKKNAENIFMMKLTCVW